MFIFVSRELAPNSLLYMVFPEQSTLFNVGYVKLDTFNVCYIPMLAQYDIHKHTVAT